jgi:hypothetical protein
LEKDCSRLITEPCVVMENGKPIIIYDMFQDAMARLAYAVKTTKYQTSDRVNGLKTTSRIFGFRPRTAIRNDYCSATSFASQQPEQHAIICEFGQKIAWQYQRRFPEEYQKQLETVQGKIRKEWIIPETPFTSGIVNKNNPLNYHYDAGNFDGVKSCMIVLKKGIQGGHLCVPAYDLRFDLKNGAVLMFDGQSILHGVSKITKADDFSYRYSIVYYSLKNMCNCGSPQEELARIRKMRLERELKKI